ncbi:DUF6496 domain-containing protein [Dechloromonas sp. A34]|uniref:DUF6496 domain-containing protein n=1 Tax=Dechloromonas sp. A34 TaxID=447588 RepID=UPI0022489ED9|nr:DUF6496 domain-containing protein [Dechloromonas sp. A34]
MPDRKAIERAEKDKREGKSPSTQAGEFVREEIHHIREGRHGARSTKQAIAIGLSEARRAGVKLPPPKAGSGSEATRRKAERDLKNGAPGGTSVSRRRAKATLGALEREGDAAATPAALAKQGRAAARQRSPAERSAAARQGAQTKGAAGRSAVARKAAQTRAARRSGG